MKQRTLNWFPAVFVNWLLVAAAAVYGVLDKRNPDSESPAILLLGLAVILLAILALILSAIVHHRCWSLLPESNRKTTPGKAVGFLFIPLFNLYWVFPSFVGLATGRMAAVQRPVAGLKGNAIAFAIAFILCIIPNTMVPEVLMLVLWTTLVGRIAGLSDQTAQTTGGEQPSGDSSTRADAGIGTPQK
jgi:hypothetical protein